MKKKNPPNRLRKRLTLHLGSFFLPPFVVAVCSYMEYRVCVVLRFLLHVVMMIPYPIVVFREEIL